MMTRRSNAAQCGTLSHTTVQPLCVFTRRGLQARLDATAEIEAQDDTRGADAQQHGEGQREQHAADGPQEDLRSSEWEQRGRLP